MSYTRPPFDAADASWSGADVYTRPDFDAADASFQFDGFQILSDGPLGTTTLVLENVPTNHTQILSDGPLGSTSLLIAKRPLLEIQILSSGPLGADGRLLISVPLEAAILSNGPLTANQASLLVSLRAPLVDLEAYLLSSGPLGASRLLVGDLSVPPISSPYQMAVANPDGSNLVIIGICLYGTSLGIVDYSRKERDEFGAITVIERGYTNRIKYNAEIRTSDAGLVRSLLASKRATLAKYIGNANESSTIVVGYLTQFNIKIEDFMTSKLDLEVEGQVITQ